MATKKQNTLEHEILELRTEPDRLTRKPTKKLFLVKLKFDPEKYMMTFPCLSCGAQGHKFSVFKDNVFTYCPKTQVTMKTSTYQSDGSTFLPFLKIVSEKSITRTEALAYMKLNRIVPMPDIALAVAG
jgi:hypothetical protein